MELRETLQKLESELSFMEAQGMCLPEELAEQSQQFAQSAADLLEFLQDFLAAKKSPLGAVQRPPSGPVTAPPPVINDFHENTPDPSGFASMPVLLVEDNMVNRKLAILILERVGCRVDVAEDGAQGVEKFKQGHYLAIFMDCQMPVMDGYEATRAIRKLEAGTSHIPIIAVTANAMKGDREKCLACGMDDYIPKPLRPNDLQEAVNRWCKVAV